MTDLTPTIRVAQLLGLGSSAIAAGGLLVTSLLVVPAILEAPPSVQAAQWARAFDTGKFVMPPFLAIGGAVHAYLAWALPAAAAPPARVLYGLAGAAVLATQPWTFLFIVPVNRRLQAAHAAAQGRPPAGPVMDKAEVPRQVAWWGRLNDARVGLTLLGVTLSVWATLALDS